MVLVARRAYLGRVKVYIDDVWSGGTAEDSERLGYPLLSKAIAGGLFHPNCKHKITTYFEGITTLPSKVDVANTRENSNIIATQRYNERMIRKYTRLEMGSLDEGNKLKYRAKVKEWQAIQRDLMKEHPEVHRNYKREKVRIPPNDKIYKAPTFFDQEKPKRKAPRYFDDFNDLPIDIKEPFEDGLKKADPHFKRLLGKHYKDVKYSMGVLVDGRDVTAINRNGLINLATNFDNPADLAHELFHYIDLKNNLTENTSIKKILLQEFNRLYSQQDIKQYLLNTHKNYLLKNDRGNIVLKSEFGYISDIISAASCGKIRLGVGHSSNYWQSNDGMVAMEVWADFGAIGYMNNDKVIMLLQELFPKTTSELLWLVKEV